MKKISLKYVYLISLVVSALLSSCSGYHFKYKDNPFERYGIKSLTVPLFLNNSLFPGASSKMTREIKEVLENQTNLTIYSGNNKNADAVLVGIVDTPKHKRDVIKTNKTTLVSSGNRPSFYIPTGNSYHMTLRLVLIKAPSKLDMSLIHSKLLPYMNKNPKVIFSESMHLSSSYARFAVSNDTGDAGEVVNFTRSKKIFEQSLDKLAKAAAKKFEGLILYAF